MPKTYCPNCDAVISVNNPREGVTVTCHECGTELEIISTNPFEVDFPLDYGEDDDEELSDEEE
jgi:alpha-aminoadipate carrier protein LysW